MLTVKAVALSPELPPPCPVGPFANFLQACACCEQDSLIASLYEVTVLDPTAKGDFALPDAVMGGAVAPPRAAEKALSIYVSNGGPS